MIDFLVWEKCPAPQDPSISLKLTAEETLHRLTYPATFYMNSPASLFHAYSLHDIFMRFSKAYTYMMWVHLRWLFYSMCSNCSFKMRAFLANRPHAVCRACSDAASDKMTRLKGINYCVDKQVATEDKKLLSIRAKPYGWSHHLKQME